MIILDTNVLSELMKLDSNPAVLAWTDRQPSASLFTTAISEAEVWMGIELLDHGRKRMLLEQAAHSLFEEVFQERRLVFDSSSAKAYGQIAATSRKSGNTVGMADLKIAAIAIAQEARLATRNTRHFAHCGIDLIDPFTPTAGR